jgi:hypothetical protein
VILLRGALGEGRRERSKRKEKIVVWILEAEGAMTKSPMMPGSINFGLSFQVGEELAKRIRQGHGWALAMHADIRRRRVDQRRWEDRNDPSSILKTAAQSAEPPLRSAPAAPSPLAR